MQIEALTHRHPGLTPADRPVVQTLPHRDHTDGFFIATYVKT
jgi:16S rRNA C967 or C1407 C5-methylase (RsmB/RsmF family)